MKTFLILFVLCLAPAILTSQDDEISAEMRHTMIKFDQHWSKFLLESLGCWHEPAPGDALAKPLTKEDCDPDDATLDYNEFLKARNLAKKVFILDEPISKNTQ